MTAPQQRQPRLGGQSDGLDSEPPALVPWFGALIGLVAGGLVGATCCWLVEARTARGLGGAATGIGAVIGVLEIWQSRRTTAESASRETATFICTLYACIPAALESFGGCGGVQKKVTG